MPTPASGELRLNQPRQETANHRKKTLVEKIRSQLRFRKVSEQLACFAPRIDARQRIAGAVSVLAQEFVGAQIAIAFFAQLARVFAQRIYRLAGDPMNKTDSGFPAQQVDAASPQAADVHAIIIRVAMIEHHYSAPARSQHAMNLAHGPRGVGCVM